MKHLSKRILALGMALCLCLSLCAVSVSAAVDKNEMPVEGNPGYGEVGPITLSLSLTKSGSNYAATYTATTTMVDWLATAATVCKDDPRMANLRFTCTLRDALTQKCSSGSISSADYTFTSASLNDVPVFVPVDGAEAGNAVKVEGGSIKLQYKLNPALLNTASPSSWKNNITSSVKSGLQQEMSMKAANMTVPTSTLAGIGSTITTTARIDITMTEGKIPFYKETSILAAKGECSISNPEYSSGGGGGGVTPAEPTIEIKDSTPSTGGASGIPEAGGTAIVDNPSAGPGEEVKIITEPNRLSMVDHITVTDKENNRILLAYDGKGIYSFEMPESGNVVIDMVFRVIPTDPDETGVSELLNTDDHALYMIGDDLGNFRPNASIKRAEVATAFFRLLRNQNVARTMHFDDVKTTNWYVQPVEVLASIDILEGVGNGDFEPERAITRAEFAAIASRFTKARFSGASFTDVDKDAWYADAVSTAAHFGWINGMGDGTFEPDRPITRTEAAAIINRMLLRISDWIDVDAGAGRHFPDVGMDFWGRYEISEATNGHDHTLEEKYFYEDWLAEDWREAVDNDPVNFGQPKF